MNHSPGRKNQKNYDGTSIVSLIEFIRDKHQHSDEISQDARGIFGETNAKYGAYFHRKFPLLIPLLFVYFQKGKYDFKLSEFYRRNNSKFGFEFSLEQAHDD